MTSVVERVARSGGKSVDTTGVTDYAGYKDRQYDALAGVLRGNLDMDRIYKIMGLDNDKR